MGQREDVTASLLASHGVDAARRPPLATASETIPAGSMVEVDGHGSIRLYRGGVSPDRQGWRARLANVERLLAKHFDGDDLAYQDGLDDSLRDALAEVRSLLGGE